jgi:hypothetical protein
MGQVGPIRCPFEGGRTMPKRTLEDRVAALERQVAELLAERKNGNDWQSTIGMFAGDEVMKRIDEAALKYRERDRERYFRRFKKTKRPTT